MTKEEIIEMAKKVGFEEHQAKFDTRFEPFAKLVAKKALETKDEPVAWGMEKDGLILDVICPAEHDCEEGEYTIPLYTTPQLKTKDEPVALQYPQKDIDWQREQQIKAQGSTTPQRTWVGLTDEERQEIHGSSKSPYDDLLLVEAKLKELNT